MTGHSMGSPHYISPEQVECMKDVDLRADIYSLGCTLYHMLSGQAPFDGHSAVSIMMKHVNAPVPELRKAWPECPPELGSVVGKMMRKKPGERQQNYGEVVTDLRRVYDVMSGASVADAVVAMPLQSVGTARRAVQAGRTGSSAVGKPPVPGMAWVGGGVALLAAVAALVYFVSWKKSDAPAGGARVVVSQTATADGEPSLADATKDKPFINSLGMKFVPVPILGGRRADSSYSSACGIRGCRITRLC